MPVRVYLNAVHAELSRYQGDCGIIVNRLSKKEAGEVTHLIFVAFTPRLTYDGFSIGENQRPPLVPAFDLQLAQASDRPVEPYHKLDHHYPGLHMWKFDGQRICCNLHLAILRESDYHLLITGADAMPTEEELLRLTPNLKTLQAAPESRRFTVAHFGALAERALANIRLAAALRRDLPVYLDVAGHPIFGSEYEGHVEALVASDYRLEKGNLQPTVDVLVEGTILNVYLHDLSRRWEIGDFVRFLPGSPNESKTAFVIAQTEMDTVYCILGQDPDKVVVCIIFSASRLPTNIS
jgi:hypothetical protein